jgi:hypothetical protein
MNIKEKSEQFALNYFLSDFPASYTFEEVLEAILEDNDTSVVVWEVFQDHPADWVVCEIENMVAELIHTFGS